MISDKQPSQADLDRYAAEYERDGVVRVPGLLSKQDVEDARREIARIGSMFTPDSPKEKVMFEADGKSVRNLWSIEHDSKWMDELSRRPSILQLVTRLVHGEPELNAVETFNKPARVGSAVPPHQDNAYFCRTPPDMLTVWIAIDAATMENGPIYYARGSHTNGVRPHKPSGVTGNSMGLAEPFDKSNLFIGTLEPGDAVIHHCQTIHYSAPNKTDRSRCGLLMVFRGKHTQTDQVQNDRYMKIRAEMLAAPTKTIT